MYDVFLRGEKNIFFCWKIRNRVIFGTPQLVQGRPKKGFRYFGPILVNFGDFRYVALFTRKSRARTAGSGPPPIQLTTRTFYVCILMDICQSKTRFATSQAPWEALARATSCDFGQKTTTGRPKVQHSANRGSKSWKSVLELQGASQTSLIR